MPDEIYIIRRSGSMASLPGRLSSATLVRSNSIPSLPAIRAAELDLEPYYRPSRFVSRARDWDMYNPYFFMASTPSYKNQWSYKSTNHFWPYSYYSPTRYDSYTRPIYHSPWYGSTGRYFSTFYRRPWWGLDTWSRYVPSYAEMRPWYNIASINRPSYW